jgi:hypothetical protein
MSKHRETRRLTEDRFLAMSRESGTVVLDAPGRAAREAPLRRHLPSRALTPSRDNRGRMRHAGFFVMLAGSAAIGLAAVYGMTGDVEPTFWLALSVTGAFVFTRTREHPARYAFPATAAAALVSPLLHSLLFPIDLAHNPVVAKQMETIPGGLSPRLFILVMAPLVAIAYGGVTSLVTLAISRMVRRNPETASH